jgi:hypothetical protein
MYVDVDILFALFVTLSADIMNIERICFVQELDNKEIFDTML